MKISKLEELADIQYGFPFNSKKFKENGRIRVVRIRDIKKPEKPTFLDDIYRQEYVIGNGDIIVGMDGEFNCIIWNFGKAVLNQRVAKIIPKNFVSKSYLYYILKIKLKEIEQRVTFATVKHLLDSHLRNLEIPFPPLNEQIRIASILGKIDELKDKREQANLMTNKILQVIFLQMFGDGNFTREPIREHIIKTEVRDPQKKPHEYFKYIDIAGIDNKSGKIVKVKTIPRERCSKQSKKSNQKG